MTVFTTTARSAKRTRQTLLRLTALTTVAMLAVAFTAAPTFAAKPVGVTGDIALAGVTTLRSTDVSPLSKGDTAFFDYTVDGKVSPKGYTYVRVVCRQDGTVVYQVSKWTDGLYFEADVESGFDLTSSTWGSGSATCDADLIYRVDGRKPTVVKLDTASFTVE